MANDVKNAHSSVTTIKHGAGMVLGPKLTPLTNTSLTHDTVSALPASGVLFPKYDARFDDPRYYTAQSGV